MDRTDRDQLARENMPLVERTVAAMRRRFGPGVEPDDLRSFAMMGLARALDRYDPSRKVPFGAYAEHTIRGAIYDGLAESSWFPRRLMRQITFYRRADDMLRHAADLPVPGDTVESAHRLADTLKELAAAYVTTYAADGDNEEGVSPAEADEIVDRKRLCRNLQAYVAALPHKQRQVIQLYFYENLNLPEICERLGFHKSWA
ncbi:MAG: sigma-70 family RNA polymerase sigma factor, partial [Deltaproteobacteria bacterium]|nr:sigma-70 family RNA polymerase sigma factor [Deltaproteobacteria bacterium]